MCTLLIVIVNDTFHVKGLVDAVVFLRDPIRIS